MPANPQVPYHSDQFFEVQPAPYWHIADVRTNGASLDIGPDNAFFSFVWNQVVATGTLEAVFAPNLAPRGTPEWWLADYGFSNEFAAAELSDLDEDGLFAWQNSAPAPARMIRCRCWHSKPSRRTARAALRSCAGAAPATGSTTSGGART